MSSFPDHFSALAREYATFRPAYPAALPEWLASRVPGARDAVVWDCGTGNGQAALALAPYFGAVIATDASPAQLFQAPRAPGVHYAAMAAERAALPDESVGLVTVAQALHWFDLERGGQRMRRATPPLLRDSRGSSLPYGSELELRGADGVPGDLVGGEAVQPGEGRESARNAGARTGGDMGRPAGSAGGEVAAERQVELSVKRVGLLRNGTQAHSSMEGEGHRDIFPHGSREGLSGVVRNSVHIARSAEEWPGDSSTAAVRT